nr:hypothetical protein Iba_chr04eCG4290 [Ipomoea batatas]GMC89737.1 hypothetical protein Iba_chr04fCG1640 [Ipomoea batatas]
MMNDKTNIWLIDTHSKRNSCTNNIDLILAPLFLNICTLSSIHAAMVICCFMSILLNLFRNFFTIHS